MAPVGEAAGRVLHLPLLALRGMVIFPHMTAPLEVGRPRSVAAVEEAASQTPPLLMLAAQRDPHLAEPSPADIYEVGTVARVDQVLHLPGGRLRAVVEGLFRARITAFAGVEPRMRVRVVPEEPAEAPWPPEPQQAAHRRSLVEALLASLEEYARLSGQPWPELALSVARAAAPERLCDVVAGQLPLPFEEKQMLLESAGGIEGLERLVALLHREIELLLAQQRAGRARAGTEAVREQAGRAAPARPMAREGPQGEGESERGSEVEELRRRIRQAGLPPAVQEKAEHELGRLEKMPPLAAEAVVVRTYLDWLLALPWNERTTDRLDIEAAERILDEDHFGLEQVKERVLEFLAVRELARDRSRGPILCLVGPPGVGKTSLARSVARALERRFVRISLGGVRDEAEIRGHRRTYVGAMPGKIVQAMRQAGVRNPVMLLDEIDKLSSDFRGDPAAALLEVLDPEQNHAFSDHYLEVPFDLSDVLFITTGNVLQAIPRPLRDRMETIAIPGYTEQEKVQIAVRHLIPRQRQAHGLSEHHLTVAPSAVAAIVRGYTREAGVRELERQIATLCRKTARRVVKDPHARVRITAAGLHRWLGPPRFHDSHTEGEDRVGLALGLAYTEWGGDLLAIEVAVVPGRGKLWLTGKLGEVMRESAQASYSYVRSRAPQLGIDPSFYERVDIHVHVPEGAIPKDGPSAGITMAVALISALSGRPVRRDVAMTGEITLRGRVLPVGGLKEKVLAAHRYGIRHLIIPADNLRDLEEVPASVRRQLHVHAVAHMDEVLRLAFSAGSWGERPSALPPREAAAAARALDPDSEAGPGTDVDGEAAWPQPA
ncbi:MAG TPA: endopeptidase La [Limnochordales bacterium]